MSAINSEEFNHALSFVREGDFLMVEAINRYRVTKPTVYRIKKDLEKLKETWILSWRK
ncbi:hypothetical protein [Listeria innocua]|uniref:hypothetical protein n=1 Tax=Listeria innocua TaxID=1642 RepID=UPI0021AB704D|nr:hypothetical protein [Listeria innocua]